MREFIFVFSDCKWDFFSSNSFASTSIATPATLYRWVWLCINGKMSPFNKKFVPFSMIQTIITINIIWCIHHLKANNKLIIFFVIWMSILIGSRSYNGENGTTLNAQTKKDWKHFWKLSIYWNEEDHLMAYMVKLIETHRKYSKKIFKRHEKPSIKIWLFEKVNSYQTSAEATFSTGNEKYKISIDF